MIRAGIYARISSDREGDNLAISRQLADCEQLAERHGWSVVERYVKLQKFGSNLVGLCPFHEDHNPSFTVFPATATFHCFGCRKRGDVIKFLQEVEHLSFSQALDALERFASDHERDAA